MVTVEKGGTWTNMASSMYGLMFILATFKQLFPNFLWKYIESLWSRLMSKFNPLIHITFDEFPNGRFRRSEAYVAIETYLGSISVTQARCLKGEVTKKSHSLVLAMDDSQEVSDVFNRITVTWYSGKTLPPNNSIQFNRSDGERRYYMLTFHRKHRAIITKQYISYVLQEGKEIGVRNRQRRLYTNNGSDSWYDYRKDLWSHVPFEHPATFDTIAMDPKIKEEIIDDLVTFKNGKEYYAKIGKAWKRGYLLYGPPGTGKSTMIAAMANLLDYDVYDLELTAVNDNTELRRLLIDISSKSIIVIEDIDCSLDLTGQRKNKKENDEQEELNPIKKSKEEKNDNESKVTLSGLLNFIDGLWSACRGERIIVFTTNHLEKLDPALIRRGRMDKHIELSYCKFEAFKVLAKTYLDIDSHPMFEKIKKLLEETDMSPADVVENIMPKTQGVDVETCLESLIQALETAKEKSHDQGKEGESAMEVGAEIEAELNIIASD